MNWSDIRAAASESVAFAAIWSTKCSVADAV